MTTMFGRTLKHLREQRGFSQSRLAQLARVDHSIVSRWESGTRHPTRDTVNTLGRVLQLDGIEQEELHHAAGFISTNEISSRRHMAIVQQVMNRAITDPAFAERCLAQMEGAA